MEPGTEWTLHERLLNGWMNEGMNDVQAFASPWSCSCLSPLPSRSSHCWNSVSPTERNYEQGLKSLRETRKRRKKKRIPPGPCIKGRICAEAGRRNKTSPMGPGSKAAKTGVRQENTQSGGDKRKAGAKHGAPPTGEEQVWVAFCLGSPDRLSRRLMGSDLPLPGLAGPGIFTCARCQPTPAFFHLPIRRAQSRTSLESAQSTLQQTSPLI